MSPTDCRLLQGWDRQKASMLRHSGLFVIGGMEGACAVG